MHVGQRETLGVRAPWCAAAAGSPARPIAATVRLATATTTTLSLPSLCQATGAHTHTHRERAYAYVRTHTHTHAHVRTRTNAHTHLAGPVGGLAQGDQPCLLVDTDGHIKIQCGTAKGQRSGCMLHADRKSWRAPSAGTQRERKRERESMCMCGCVCV
jgi:hypothetical protein